MPSPVPSLDPVRRNARVGPLKLPASGRKGEPAAWPLETRPSAAEKRLWAQLWASPQAVVWERLGWTRVVARYTRLVIKAEEDVYEMASAQLSHVLALEDRLGLTPKAMRILLWEIAPDELGERREAAPASKARGRLKAVE